MKSIKRKIAALICGVALFCGMNFNASARKGSTVHIPTFPGCSVFVYECSSGQIASGAKCGSSAAAREQMINDALDIMGC